MGVRIRRAELLALVALAACSKSGGGSNSAAPTAPASAAAVVSAAPPAPVANPMDGLSLSETFDLIQGALASQGPVAWQGIVHDSAPPPGQTSDWTYQRRVVVSNYSYDLPNCTFSFHYHVVTDGKVSTDVDAGAPLRLAKSIQVASEASLVAQRDAQAGHSSWSSRIQPPIYDVDIVRGDGVDNAFSFYDLTTANRVAQAFQHAATLCGVTPTANF